jgi:hypothetical protein
VQPLIDRSRKLAERIDTPHSLGFHHLAESNCHYLAGAFRSCSEAALVAEQALTERARGSTWELNTLRFFWGMALSYQGRYRELRRRSSAWLVDAEEREDLCAQAGFRLNRARSSCLADDDPERAHAELELGLRQWSLPDLGVHRFLAEMARAQIQLYEGKPEESLDTVNALWAEFRTSSMSRVQLCRVHMRHYTTFGSLALASEREGRERNRLLSRAKRHERKLRKERTAWGDALAEYVLAQRLLFAGKLDAAYPVMQQALVALEQVHLHPVVAAARVRFGQALGGDEGAGWAQRGEAELLGLGVTKPERFVRMLAPGV